MATITHPIDKLHTLPKWAQDWYLLNDREASYLCPNDIFFYQRKIYPGSGRNKTFISYVLYSRTEGGSAKRLETVRIPKLASPYSMIEELELIVKHWNEYIKEVVSTPVLPEEKFYIVTTEETYEVHYILKASEPEEAIKKLADTDLGDIEFEYDREFIEMNSMDEWEVEEADKAQIDFAVQKDLYYS